MFTKFNLSFALTFKDEMPSSLKNLLQTKGSEIDIKLEFIFFVSMLAVSNMSYSHINFLSNGIEYFS